MPIALPPQLAKLFKKPVASSAFGLDIGSSSIKGVLLARGPSGLRLERFAAVPLPPGAGKPEQVKGVQEVLQKVSPPRDARVVTAVSGAGTVIRSVDFPKMTLAELLNMEPDPARILDEAKHRPK